MVDTTQAVFHGVSRHSSRIDHEPFTLQQMKGVIEAVRNPWHSSHVPDALQEKQQFSESLIRLDHKVPV